MKKRKIKENTIKHMSILIHIEFNTSYILDETHMMIMCYKNKKIDQMRIEEERITRYELGDRNREFTFTYYLKVSQCIACKLFFFYL